MSVRNGCTYGGVKPLDVYDYPPIVHRMDGFQGADEVATIFDVDGEGIGLRYIAIDGAERLATSTA